MNVILDDYLLKKLQYLRDDVELIDENGQELATIYRVNESKCVAVGDAVCEFVIQKEPIG